MSNSLLKTCSTCGQIIQPGSESGLVLDVARNLVIYKGKTMRLTHQELKCLAGVTRRAPHVVSGWNIYDYVYGDPDYKVQLKTIHVLMHKVRCKLERADIGLVVGKARNKGYYVDLPCPVDVTGVVAD